MKANLQNGKKYNEEQEEGSSGDVPNYELAFEIQCGATVGSAAVAAIPDGSGDVEIFVPSYEVNKVIHPILPLIFSELQYCFLPFPLTIYSLPYFRYRFTPLILTGTHIPPDRQRLASQYAALH